MVASLCGTVGSVGCMSTANSLGSLGGVCDGTVASVDSSFYVSD